MLIQSELLRCQFRNGLKRGGAHYYESRIRSRMTEGPIQATRLTDLELNDRDICEAVDQWVYTHYKKKGDGVKDFRLDENGFLVCKGTVRDES